MVVQSFDPFNFLQMSTADPSTPNSHYLQVTCPKCGKNMLFKVDRGQEKVRLNCCNCKIAIDVHCKPTPASQNNAGSAQPPASQQSAPPTKAGGSEPSSGTGQPGDAQQRAGAGPSPPSNNVAHNPQRPDPSLFQVRPSLARIPRGDGDLLIPDNGPRRRTTRT